MKNKKSHWLCDLPQENQSLSITSQRKSQLNNIYYIISSYKAPEMDCDSSTLEDQRERMDNAILTAMEDLDRDYLRKLQIEMHACASACCADVDANAEAVERCVDRCQIRLTRARCFVQQGMSDFENKLEKCIQQCRVHGSDYHLERCTNNCVDSHVGLLPEMLRAMRDTLEKGV
ncbi:protein FAM136A [Drosophila eugracilis]|uniref:protein FAM136A n=1 Tax=Drosophila eugracilis TaxID=29029 RepID=UPI0007E72687|nr:protein FAM136A [Drosophila eugracilis]